MPAQQEKIAFDHLGIGDVLATKRLRVPLNQREYSWEAEHVDDLFSDLINAKDTDTSYFLGTIVLTRGEEENVPEVSDGQQRLSTVMIMLAAVRDWFLVNGDDTRAKVIEERYLFSTDLETTDSIPKLTLNVDDNEFFRKRILSRPGSPERNQAKATRASHERLGEAYTLARAKLDDILAAYSSAEHKTRRITSWVDYLEKRAEVILLAVPGHIDAFVMFETLNDRGLRISQADLLKNHLLRLAKDQIQEAQQSWAKMVGVLESINDDDGLTVTYLHHYLIMTKGETKERDVFDRVKAAVTNKAAALAFSSNLTDAAVDYAALFNAEHIKWNAYENSVRQNIATINRDLQVEQIRPLMFSVARNFSAKQTALAFRMFVAWSVRFLIVGGRGGLLNRNYAVLAAQVGTKQIRTAKDLAAAATFVPNDAAFEASFATARVSKNALARYYLRALEQERKGQADPEWVPSDDEKIVNLEHVLPENPGGSWPALSKDDALAFFRRIGNLAIMQAKKNSDLGNKPFAVKRVILGQSAFLWTSDIAQEVNWGPAEIADRQRRLAKSAVKTWPVRGPNL